MRGNAVILTPVLEGVQGRNELFTGAAEAVFAVVVAAATGFDDSALGGDALGAVAVAAVVTAGLTVDTTAGATLEPAAGAGGSDTGAGGPIWPEGVY